ncbi:glycoside hydrolase superfamily [Durotheca rogersii]|uniref:glycoside hydrolase superfamily n=1 Tax=Durotheca rogersii TaxID=419775 RepID=UPI00221E6A70|nr:glycoside hydrolase superfamily [Durotheca rogersii]KAI5863043.1 glycoside hydrolase superfamily [Durotheca rogersii]
MLLCQTAGWLARLFLFLKPVTCSASGGNSNGNGNGTDANANATVPAPPPPVAVPSAPAVNDHRVVVYYQTTNRNNSATSHISLLPLLEAAPSISVTHVLVGAIHIVDEDGGIRLNDYPPENPFFDGVWADVAQLQAAGVTVMGMLGGAARGSFRRLDGDDAQFERYYGPLRDFVGTYNLQGLDLDVEEAMSLGGVVRLIDRLKADFGDGFVVSLAPVASALTAGGGNLSGFDYGELEASRGGRIAFYNAQFYFGWGDASRAADYEAILDDGFPAAKVVMGVLTSPANGNGYVSLSRHAPVLAELAAENPAFGGVAGWEYFNSLPGGGAAPWQWAAWVADHIRSAGTKRDISTTEAVWRGVRKAGRRVRRGAKVYRDYIA